MVSCVTDIGVVGKKRRRLGNRSAVGMNQVAETGMNQVAETGLLE
jgi:hypothetical protein